MQVERKQLAVLLVDAQESGKPVPAEYRQEFTLEEAYAVQVLVRDEKIRRGHRVLGKKVGFTGRAMRQQFNFDQPDYGNLFSDQIFTQGAAIDTSRFVAPKVEGEIAFIMQSDLSGPHVTVADVLRATYGVMACLEFVDSRWDFGITVLDSIADNAGCGGFALGSKLLKLEGVDLRYTAMFVEKNGVLISSGAGIEVLGDPLNSIAWLVNKLAEHGDGLRAGDIVLSGAISGATPAVKGDVFNVSFSNLGSIGVRFE